MENKILLCMQRTSLLKVFSFYLAPSGGKITDALKLKVLQFINEILKFEVNDFFIFIFSTVYDKPPKCSIKTADDWIRTLDLWCPKWLICQLYFND